MKKYIRMKKRFSLCCVAILMMGLIGIPMSVRAEDTILTYPLYHKHIADCEDTVYETISADTSSSLRTVKTDTCACGGHHDYYEFNASCSCGRTWHTTGHACINSIAGSYQGSCGNYAWINCETSHIHPVRGYICGKTDETVIDTVMVKSSTFLPSQEVTLTAMSGGALEDIELEWKDREGLSEITVNENGTYHLYATYTENQIEYISDISVEVSNIDHELPAVSEIAADKQEFTSESIILSVGAEDSGGLPEDYISWNGEEFGNSGQYEVAENGTYSVVVTDIAGNKVTKTITIENIDTTAPVIVSVDKNPNPWYSGKCLITVEAKDLGNGNDGSGLALQAYSWDEGTTWTDKNNIEIEEAGIITVQVRDAVGNIAYKEIEVARQSRPVNSDGNEEDEFVRDIIKTEKEYVKEKNKEGDTSEKINDQEKKNSLLYQFLPERTDEFDKFSVEEIVVESNPVYQSGDNMELETLQKQSGENLGVIVLLSVLCGIAGLALLLWILYQIGGMCYIYEIDNRQKETYLGRTGIRMRSKKYCIKIKAGIMDKATTRTLKVKLPGWFVKMAEYRPFRIIAGECVMEQYVEKEIKFHIQS